MRLKRLRLRRYGSFEDADLDLASEPGRISLIVAPNGAGKSVLRQAFHDLLFDIPLQSPMKFRHGYAGMALEAEAVDAEGVAFGFGWVRGGKPARVTSDAARFAALQRGVTPQQLERLFALDTARLREGGTDLKGGSTLAGALLAGTGELAPAKSVRSAIEVRRAANWGQGKSKPPLNAASSALAAARKSLNAAVQRPEQRDGQERELQTRRARHDEAKRTREAALAETRRLNRIALTRQPLQQLQTAEAWLLANADAPALPAGLDAALAEARAARATALATAEGASQALAGARAAASSITRDPVAQHFAQGLAELPGKLGEADNKVADLVERRSQYATKLEDVQDALREIGSAVPPQEAGDVIPTAPIRAEAQAAMTREAALRAAASSARARVAAARRDSDEALPGGVAAMPDGLVALLEEIRADRNPVQHAAEAAEADRVAAAALTRALALVPGWTGTASALRGLALMPEAGFERLDRARQAAVAVAERAGEQMAGLQLQDQADRRALAELQRQALPDEAAIAAARETRDRGMRLVLRQAFGPAPSAAETAAYAGQELLAVVYEREVRRADGLADQREAELARVQEAARLQQSLSAAAAPLAEAVAADADAAARLAASVRAWAEAVAPLGMGPQAGMAEARTVLAGRVRVIEAMAAAEAASGAAAALRAVHEAWAARLAGLLEGPPGPLAELLSQADARVAAVRSAERAAALRQARLDAARHTLRDARDAQAEAERGLVEWGEAWDGVLLRMGRPAAESPGAVAAVLEGITTLAQHHRDAVSLKRRIDDMERDLARFAATVAGLAEAMGTALQDTPAATARLLIERAERARQAESASRQAQSGLAQAEAAAAAAARALEAARQGLAAVVAACGASGAEDAEARIAASRAHAEQVALRDAARRVLAEHGGGLAEAVLRSEADAVPAVEMTARLDAAAAAATQAAGMAEAAAIAVDQLGSALDADSEATAAVDARANFEASAAEFSRRLEEQLVLNLASAMLGTALRSVEETLGGASLARVSQTFSAVTAHAYRLETRETAEGEELYAVERAFPAERKSLGELSEGTRDQLYLALRMVALRDHCASATALPFIADDILQTFDDERARATLVALGELSEALQVIVLTHHTHLEGLAATLGPERVQVLRL